MPIIRLATEIRAPIEACFDAARDIDLHVESMQSTNERAVAGVTAGLINLNDEVTWEATHFGIRQRLTSRITRFDRPRSFRDSQVRGAFSRFDHDHFFHHADDITTMTDVFDDASPLGPLGRIADLLFLRRYMERMLRERAAVIRSAVMR